MSLPAELMDRCRERFSREHTILDVWLFGSAHHGTLREDSDVDFALRFRDGLKTDWPTRGNLIADLETLLGRTVDLGVLDSGNLVYAHEVISRGTLLYSQDAAKAMAYALQLQALYFDLKIDRRPVENAYRA